jgi:hypothetical protein
VGAGIAVSSNGWAAAATVDGGVAGGTDAPFYSPAAACFGFEPGPAGRRRVAGHIVSRVGDELNAEAVAGGTTCAPGKWDPTQQGLHVGGARRGTQSRVGSELSGGDGSGGIFLRACALILDC